MLSGKYWWVRQDKTQFWDKLLAQKRLNLIWRHSPSVQKGPPLTSICKWLAYIMPKDYTDSKFGFSFSDFQTAFYLIFKSVPASRDFWTVLCEAFHLCVLFYCIGSWVVSNVNAFTNLPTLLLFECFLCMWCILSARVLQKGNTTHLNCFSFAALPLMIPVGKFF